MERNDTHRLPRSAPDGKRFGPPTCDPFEQIAPGRVDVDGKNWIILRRTDANPADSAWFDAAHATADAVGGYGSEASKPCTAKKPVESGTNRRGESQNLSPELAAKAARCAQELERFANLFHRHGRACPAIHVLLAVGLLERGCPAAGYAKASVPARRSSSEGGHKAGHELPIQFRESISRSKSRRYDSPCTVSRCGSFSPSR